MPIEQPPNIRGKNIVDGEIDSQKIATDLQSDNYVRNVSGWFISKVNGNVEFNEGIFRGDVAISGNLEVSGTDGILVFGGGDITIGDGGDITVADGGDITIASGGQLIAGPTTLDAAGLTIGTDVVIDSTGLKIEGGLVKALDVAIKEQSLENQDLTDTFVELASVSFTVPSWAQTAQVMAWGAVRVQSTSASLGILASVRVDDVDDGSHQQDVTTTATAWHAEESTLTGGALGSTIKVSTYGRRNGGSNQIGNVFPSVWALAVFTR